MFTATAKPVQFNEKRHLDVVPLLNCYSEFHPKRVFSDTSHYRLACRWGILGFSVDI